MRTGLLGMAAEASRSGHTKGAVRERCRPDPGRPQPPQPGLSGKHTGYRGIYSKTEVRPGEHVLEAG